ncbi:ABC transporter substrate-binding protein [Idiomarina xiamenensis]|uniref:ABC transporter substrate-binding protein n=1 Tax=Idiomarina xiamenensis TaxID=1207041 RepID=UPI002351EC02|nr:ABC transporter substrate-binding protein [Idiomarina xiamenensis]
MAPRLSVLLTIGGGLEYVTGHRSESRALMVKSGQTDIVYNLDPASVELLKHADNVNVDSTLIPRTILIKLNAEQTALKDKRVRQALSLAIDRQGIANNILRVPGSEANQLFGPSFQQWHQAQLAPIERNLARAGRLLDDAGWRLAKDGLRYQHGQPLRLSMMTYANRPELIVIATAIQDQWRELGVDLQVSMENASAIPMAHVRGNLQTALIARNLGLLPDPLALLSTEFSDPQGGDWGPMNWHNTQVFNWVEQLEGSQDDAQSARLIRQITDEINADLPLIPVAYYVQQSAVSTRLNGFHFDPYERSFNLSSLTLANEQ